MIKEAQCIAMEMVHRSPTGNPGHNVSHNTAEGQLNATGWKSNIDRHYQAQLK